MPPYRDERIDSSDSKIIRWLKLDHFEPERTLTSYFVSSKTLFMIRIPLVLYSAIVMWADIGTSISTGEINHYFAYFTRFTFIGLHAYLVVSIVFILMLLALLLVIPHLNRLYFFIIFFSFPFFFPLIFYQKNYCYSSFLSCCSLFYRP